MGRTNPTFRDYLRKFEERSNIFRRALRHQHQEHFDRLMERAQSHADAAGYMNSTNPEVAILLSICLSQEIELQGLRDRLEDDVSRAVLNTGCVSFTPEEIPRPANGRTTVQSG